VDSGRLLLSADEKTLKAGNIFNSFSHFPAFLKMVEHVAGFAFVYLSIQ